MKLEKDFKMDGNAVLVRTSALCELFGVCKQAVSKWSGMGCPKAGRGWWNLQEVISWRSGAFVTDEDVSADDLKARKLQAETLFREERARREKIRREQDEGTLFPYDDIAEAWASRCVEMKSSLLNLAKRMPPEVRETVREEVHEFLLQYSREGRYTPPPEGWSPGD